VVLGMWFALALTLGAPVAIDVIAGSDFDPAVDILRVQALAFVVSFPAVVWGHALLSLHRHKTLLVVNLVALVVMAAVTSTLTALEGADGAAVGTAIGELVLAVAAGTALFRLRPACAPALARAVRAPAAALLAAGAAVASGLPAAGQVALASLIYVVCVFAFRAAPEELIVELRRLAGRRT
jgi:O-antigen/teichoic acid export membrane protein